MFCAIITPKRLTILFYFWLCSIESFRLMKTRQSRGLLQKLVWPWPQWAWRSLSTLRWRAHHCKPCVSSSCPQTQTFLYFFFLWRTSTVMCLSLNYGCHGIWIVALPAARNACMFPSRWGPAEGRVISLTSLSQTTLARPTNIAACKSKHTHTHTHSRKKV